MTFTARNFQDFDEIFDEQLTPAQKQRENNRRRDENLALRHPDEQQDEIVEWDDE